MREEEERKCEGGSGAAVPLLPRWAAEQQQQSGGPRSKGFSAFFVSDTGNGQTTHKEKGEQNKNDTTGKLTLHLVSCFNFLFFSPLEGLEKSLGKDGLRKSPRPPSLVHRLSAVVAVVDDWHLEQ